MSVEPLPPPDNVIQLTVADGRSPDLVTAYERMRRLLRVTKEGGAPMATLSNAIVVIRHDPNLRDICAFNEFTNGTMLLGPPPILADGDLPQPGPYPREWTETDVELVQSYVQRVHISTIEKANIERAMDAAASTRRFHPIRDWLNGLTWDGVPRVDTWLCHILGAEDTPYVRSVGAKFLIAAVRRVRHPGCKFDCILVLESPQGHKKSTTLAVLFAPWFTDSLHAELSNRDAAIGLRDNWCIELAELEQILKSESEVIKAFLSRAVDDYVPRYGRKNIKQPRQCVLVGTTNKQDYLKDVENRRFWPVRVQNGNIDLLQQHRKQLWAEAAAREARGEDHWFDDLTNREVREQQESRLQDDAWDEKIAAWLVRESPAGAAGGETTVAEILSGCLFIPPGQQRRAEQMRVASALTRMGWVNYQARRNGIKCRVWRPALKQG